MRLPATPLVLAGVAGGLAACALGGVRVPSVPDAIEVTGETAFLRARADGVQIYACRRQMGKWEWQFSAPEAALFDAAGNSLGRHYAGPTWEAPDGSKVVGEVVGRADMPGAIPWLLLRAKSTTPGVFGAVTHIQRVATRGGTAPREGCDAARENAVERVPYAADYYFYRAR